MNCMEKSEAAVLVDFNKYNTLVFDCDGVILNSNKIKTEAFYELTLPYGKDVAEQFVNYHQTHGGISRFQKLEHFFSTILHRTEYIEDLNLTIEKYGKLVKEKLLTCSLIPGFLEFIQKIPAGQHRRVIISGGFESELREVFERRKLSIYFDGIFGSPDTKYEILERETQNNFIKYPAIFFGDSKLDFEVAVAYKMDFVFLSEHTEFPDWENYFENNQVQIIRNWNDLKLN